jgi:hypothetical protein
MPRQSKAPLSRVGDAEPVHTPQGQAQRRDSTRTVAERREWHQRENEESGIGPESRKWPPPKHSRDAIASRSTANSRPVPSRQDPLRQLEGSLGGEACPMAVSANEACSWHQCGPGDRNDAKIPILALHPYGVVAMPAKHRYPLPAPWMHGQRDGRRAPTRSRARPGSLFRLSRCVAGSTRSRNTAWLPWGRSHARGVPGLAGPLHSREGPRGPGGIVCSRPRAESGFTVPSPGGFSGRAASPTRLPTRGRKQSQRR